jgi:hypothetical protein
MPTEIRLEELHHESRTVNPGISIDDAHFDASPVPVPVDDDRVHKAAEGLDLDALQALPEAVIKTHQNTFAVNEVKHR